MEIWINLLMSTNTANTTNDLIQGVLNHGPAILDHCLFKNGDEIQQYFEKLAVEHLNYPVPKKTLDKAQWFIPIEYQQLNIEEFLISQCPKENYDRVIAELELFKQHNMIPVLQAMKFIVDTLRENNVVWGVGRGSSVASYVLHLIGVHKIDSVKYKLPIEEFFKGDQNG
jgi:DNA polymerase III alpha subunit